MKESHSFKEIYVENLDIQEFERKIELGRNLNKIINEEGFNIHSFPGSMKEALETYELYGKNMDMAEIN